MWYYIFMSENHNLTSISVSTSTMVRAVLVVIFVFLIWFLRDLVLVMLTSIVIASFMESSVPYFEKMGVARIPGVVILYVVSFLALAGTFYLFAPLLITEIYNFSIFISSYVPGVSFLDYFKNEAFSGAKDIVGALSGNFSLSGLLSVSKAFILNLSGGFFQTLAVAFGSIFNFVLIIVLSFYLSIQEKGIENFLRIIIPVRYEDYAVDLWSRSSIKIGLWVRGQMLVAFVVAVLIYLILSLLGIEYALLLAIIVGITEMVPYGILVALIPTFAFSYISNGFASAFMVAGAYIIVHQFEVFLFSPLIIKKIVGLSPIVIILSVLIGFELGGIWGAIISIPMAVIIMEFLSDIEKDKILARTKNV
ncbi:MAG: putative permease [Candidatus Nomurabacteria bacterium GW2011_GWA2_43_66]|nr:MAG: putative permease [Parcubacteria group bacterium GW2011_GWC1_42_21]KKS57717.1 MAG: putative permease [Candidatus Nomurabacteria bacterium GW2011_GWF1_42_40]KKT00481.1 MAG: putative permease [Candidatus Nomurabacteria bacterium GW2011_GWA1_43_17]KKT18032.1 MAG: putative permease [Candidatus Nomurabacteria bacterium GW2011_GWA2_43_66]